MHWSKPVNGKVATIKLKRRYFYDNVKVGDSVKVEAEGLYKEEAFMSIPCCPASTACNIVGEFTDQGTADHLYYQIFPYAVGCVRTEYVGQIKSAITGGQPFNNVVSVLTLPAEGLYDTTFEWSYENVKNYTPFLGPDIVYDTPDGVYVNPEAP